MNNDLISRQAAIDDAHSQIWYRLNPNMKERIDTWLVNLPAVQPKQKTGHWITDGVDYRCSACGFEINDEYYLGEGIACPNCGTFMPDGLKNVLGR